LFSQKKRRTTGEIKMVLTAHNFHFPPDSILDFISPPFSFLVKMKERPES
jgi:hypothetical protein